MSMKPADPRKLAKTDLPFAKFLTPDEERRVQRLALIRSYEAGAVIHSRDQDCLGFIQVLKGKARTVVFSDEGREVTLYQLEAGDVDVLTASCVLHQLRFDTQLLADEDTELLIVPAHCLAELKEENLALRCYLYEQLTERFSDTMQTMQAILFVRIDARVADHLLEQAEGAPKGAPLRITHEQIAREISSTREVVSRVLKRMEKDGLLKLGRGSITILNADGLEALI